MGRGGEGWFECLSIDLGGDGTIGMSGVVWEGKREN